MDSSISESTARVGGKGRKKGNGKGASNQSEPTIEKYRAPRDKNWSRQETDLLIVLVGERLKARNNGNEGNLNPTAEEWNYIVSQFNYRSGESKRQPEKLKNRWKTLKADFSFFKDFASRSGHGWIEADGIPDVTPEAWDSYIKKDEKRYKPYRYKKFPWFRAMDELCGSSIATCEAQITTDPTIPIVQNLDSDSSGSVESLHEAEEVLGTGTTVDQSPHAHNLPCDASASDHVIETEQEHVKSVAGKRKRGDTSRTELTRNNKKNATYRKTEIAHTFLNQQKSRNEILDKVADNLQKNPKYGDIQKEVIDRLKVVLDPKSPTYHSDYYDMLSILGNDWVRGCFMNEEDNMLRGYIEYTLRRHRAGLPLIPDLGGSGMHYPSPNSTFMPYLYGMANAPSHMMHPSSSPSSMAASPFSNLRSMNNTTSHVNFSGDDQATPCTPSSQHHPASSDFYQHWT